MTLWLDAHLSPRIARWITERFQIVAKPLREVGFRDAEDDVIWAAAARRMSSPRILISRNAFAVWVRRQKFFG
jgi:predicted nuclease of predicted toxin-antitoxin system